MNELVEFHAAVAELAAGRTFSAGVTLWRFRRCDSDPSNQADWHASIHYEDSVRMVAHVHAAVSPQRCLEMLREQLAAAETPA